MIHYIFLFTSIFGLTFPTNLYLIWIKSLFGHFPTSVSKDVTKVHCIMAKICALDAIVWLFLKGIYAPTLILCIGGYIWSKGWQKKYETTIMEYMAFTSAYTGVVICAIKSLLG